MLTTADKYWWIQGHVAFLNVDMIECTIEITPHNVCPLTERIERYEFLNTKTQYWVELIAPWQDPDSKEWFSSHEVDLDCGGWSYDEAIDNLYQLVLKKYGPYTEEEYDDKFNELHKTATMRPFSQQIVEDRREWSRLKLSDENRRDLEDIIVREKNTLNALLQYKENATMTDDLRKAIETTECEIWVMQESLRKGIDIDL